MRIGNEWLTKNSFLLLLIREGLNFLLYLKKENELKGTDYVQVLSLSTTILELVCLLIVDKLKAEHNNNRSIELDNFLNMVNTRTRSYLC